MTQYAVSTAQITLLTTSKTHCLHALFAHFADQPWAMLLDSAGSAHVDGRFDIMVANPERVVVTQNGLTCITEKGITVQQETDDPIALLQQTMEDQFGPQSTADGSHPHLPFTVGALGYFGYDLGRHFEKLPVQAIKDMPIPDMAVGLYSWSVVKDNKSGEFFVCRAYPGAGPDDKQLLDWLGESKPRTTFSLTSAWRANMDKGEYQQKLGAIHQYLEAGDCYQVNLAQRFSAQFKGDPYEAYCTLRSANHAPFSAYINLPQGAILSISPERFLSVKNGHVETKPIKGTRPRHTDPEDDDKMRHALRESEKDRAENLMIVDLLRNDLSKHCTPGSVSVPMLFDIESFPAVHHLVSTVTGELAANCSPLDLFKGAFPGGSITGAPKIRAMEIIEELEPHRRSIYCGSIGYVDVHGSMDTSICIRTLVCDTERIHCWAGGGIVLDSDPNAEYQECLDKVARILPVLSTGS